MTTIIIIVSPKTVVCDNVGLFHHNCFTHLQNVVYDRPGEVPGGGEDGRVVEHAHLVARDLVIL